jgi:hypothetical protein
MLMDWPHRELWRWVGRQKRREAAEEREPAELGVKVAAEKMKGKHRSVAGRVMEPRLETEGWGVVGLEV